MKTKFPILTFLLLCINGYGQTPSEAAKTVAAIYQLPETKLYDRNNLEILGRLVTSQDPAFELYYPNGERLDSVLGKKHDFKRSSGFVVSRVIADEEIWAEINHNRKLFKRYFGSFSGPTIRLDSPDLDVSLLKIKPNWRKLHSKIKRKYNAYYAKRSILWAKIDFYRVTKQFDLLANAYVSYIREYPIHIETLVNQVAWEDIFPNVTDPKLLLKVANAYKPLMIATDQKYNVASTNFYDTYANLLHKAGQTKEAIAWQEKAFELESNEAIKKGFKENLNKMKRGLPTWSGI